MENINREVEEPTTTPGTSVPRDMTDHTISSRSSLEGERKQVTVLFADVAGFTPLAEELDPEETHDMLKPAIDIMASEVHTYEGTVAQFMGDGLMALFGAPLAHEDDPQRAIYAALAMQRRLAAYGKELEIKGMKLQMRIGINTGLVMVGSIGDDLAMEYTAIGDTVNLASRMESSAEPGTVQVAESTYRLVQGFFEFESLGELEIKGKKKAVGAYRVLGELPTRSRIYASITRGLSPFVGREKELDQLTDCYAQAKAGQGQVVGLVGEPGVGKSRLLLQFRELLPPEEYTYLEGGCIHYGEAIAYLPILGILRDYFDIREGQDETISKQKMDKKLISVNGQLAHTPPPLQELLSLEVDDQSYLSLEPAQRRERVFEAIRYLLMAESQQRPLILAIEDLHWIDRTSEEFMSSFIEGLPTASVLLILLYRPEYTPDWISKTSYSQVCVDQLPEKPSIKLVDAILSEGEVAPEVSDFIIGKTAGNPLFIEELTRGLLESGSITKDNQHYVLSTKPAEIQVPDTIQGIIASRLDRLPEYLKETLQLSSVIGRDFSLRLLQEVTSINKPLKSYLLRLQSLEFIFEKSVFPEPEYIFKHALTQEVAYNSLLIRRRKETHEKIGQAIERIYRNNLEEFFEVLAYHYSHSGDLDKALTYLKLAGDKTTRDYSLWEAMGFYREAISLLDSQPQTERRDREKIAVYLSMLNPLRDLGFPEGSLQILQEAEQISEDLKDNASLAAVYGKSSLYHSYKGDLYLAMDYSEKCFDASEKVGEIESMATVAMNIYLAMLLTGRFLQLETMSRRVLERLEERHMEKGLFSGGRNVFANQCGYCGLALSIMGDFKEARAVLERGLKIALEVDDAFGIGWEEYAYSLLSIWEGEAISSIDHAHKAIESYERAGVEVVLGTSWSFLGTGYFLLGDYETARTCAERGLEIQRGSGFAAMSLQCYYSLALIRLAAEDLDGAIESAREGLKLSQEFGAGLYEAMTMIVFGRIMGEEDPVQIDVAEGYIRQGISIAEEMNMIPASAQGYLYLGEVFGLANRREEALENLRKAEEMLKEMGVAPNSYWLTRTWEAIARLESAT
jgi:class 3 adenylate cyclase/tetratricopeptide (TPR) repeat protein